MSRFLYTFDQLWSSIEMIPPLICSKKHLFLVYSSVDRLFLCWVHLNLGSSWTCSMLQVNIQHQLHLSLHPLWLLRTFSHEIWLFSCSVMSDSLRPHGLQHTRHPCPALYPGACSHSRPLSWWYPPTILSSVIPLSSCLHSSSASGSFPVSPFFASVAKVLELQLQHQSFQWIFRVYFL